MRLVLFFCTIAVLQLSGEAFTSTLLEKSALGVPGTSRRPVLALSATTKALNPNDAPLGSAAPAAETPLTAAEKKKQERKALIRKEGGLFAFDTKYGALNPFAIYYGLVSIILGIPWFIALTLCQLMYKITGDRFDRRRRIVITITHVWGTLLMRLTHCFPKIENHKTLLDFYKE